MNGYFVEKNVVRDLLQEQLRFDFLQEGVIKYNLYLDDFNPELFDLILDLMNFPPETKEFSRSYLVKHYSEALSNISEGNYNQISNRCSDILDETVDLLFRLLEFEKSRIMNLNDFD